MLEILGFKEEAPPSPLSIVSQIEAATQRKTPKKFGGDTEASRAAYRDRVLTTWEFIQDQGTVNADIVSKKLGMHVDTARDHLKVLTKEGKVTRFMVKGWAWFTVARPAPRRK